MVPRRITNISVSTVPSVTSVSPTAKRRCVRPARAGRSVSTGTPSKKDVRRVSTESVYPLPEGVDARQVEHGTEGADGKRLVPELQEALPLQEDAADHHHE